MRPNSLRLRPAVLLAALLLACTPVPGVSDDAGQSDRDAGQQQVDSGQPDGSDAGAVDAGAADAGSVDAGEFDAGAADAGAVDAGALDSGLPDAGSDDAGGSADAGQVSDAGTCQACTRWSSSSLAGLLAEPALVELSGLAASRDHAGVLYAHNDSGDTARFFALSTTGAALGEFRLDGGSATDWEDIAVGTCPAGSCVYIGDIGDNSSSRSNYAIYRITEPNVTSSGSVGIQSVTFDRFPFQYPNNAHHNAESLVFEPNGQNLYVITKEGVATASSVYRLPSLATPGVMQTLVFVATLRVPGTLDLPLTGADVNGCGNSLLLRMYNRAVQITASPGQTFEQMLTNTPTQVPAAAEPQGEAIGFSVDGRSYFTSTERVTAGQPVPLNVVTCQ